MDEVEGEFLGELASVLADVGGRESGGYADFTGHACCCVALEGDDVGGFGVVVVVGVELRVYGCRKEGDGEFPLRGVKFAEVVQDEEEPLY